MLAKRIIKFTLIGLIVLITVMMSTVPPKAIFDHLISKEYGIECNTNGVCETDDKRIMNGSSHFRDAFIFASYEKEFTDEEGHETIIRTLGVFNMIFHMEDGVVWEALN